MRWLLNTVYMLLLVALSPVIGWRIFRHGRYRQGLSEKLFGLVQIQHDGRPTVWFHAVSVGEVIQLQKVVEEFRRQTKDRFLIVVSTSTDTGWELVQKRFSGCKLTWFPLDFSWAVRNAILRIQPAQVVLMELELWPNFLMECARQSIPVSVINARMSERSHRGYSRARPLLRPIFRTLALVASQSQTYADRLQSLGVLPQNIRVTGSIKFDGVETSRTNLKTARLRKLFGLAENELVFMAGSTQEPEEDLAIESWKTLRNEFSNLRLILVPRHKERFDEVANLVKAAGIPLLRRSTLETDDKAENTASIVRIQASELQLATPKPLVSEAPAAVNPVLLLDTIGELSACWGLADIAFVGGSFSKRGGQNMIEPAAYGASVLFGPNTWNFRDVVEAFRSANACIQMQTPGQLTETILLLLRDASERTRLANAGRQLVEQQQGATLLTAELLVNIVQPQASATLRIFRDVA